MAGPAVVFVTLTLRDAQSWPDLKHAANRLGAYSAVLQGDGPALVAQLDALAEVHEVIELVGVTLSPGPCPSSWLSRVASWWLSDRRIAITIHVHSTIHRLPAALPTGHGRTITAKDNTLSSPAWQDVPPCSKHLLVCRGPRCNARGADAIANAVSQELACHGLTDDQVLVSHTGCLYPCNQAPVVAVQPDMTWHGLVTADKVRDLIQELADSRDHRQARLIL